MVDMDVASGLGLHFFNQRTDCSEIWGYGRYGCGVWFGSALFAYVPQKGC